MHRQRATHSQQVCHFAATKLQSSSPSIRTLLSNAWFLYRSRAARRVAYPLAMSYSDFLVVPAAVMEEFCHYCGVFAAMGVFVECAIPTALALAARSIKLERDIPWRGVEHFNLEELNLEELADFENQHRRDPPSLLAAFPRDAIYIHPIKLSRWERE